MPMYPQLEEYVWWQNDTGVCAHVDAEVVVYRYYLPSMGPDNINSPPPSAANMRR